MKNEHYHRGLDVFQEFLGDMMDDYYTHLWDSQNFMRHNDQIINPHGYATVSRLPWIYFQHFAKLPGFQLIMKSKAKQFFQHYLVKNNEKTIDICFLFVEKDIGIRDVPIMRFEKDCGNCLKMKTERSKNILLF